MTKDNSLSNLRNTKPDRLWKQTRPIVSAIVQLPFGFEPNDRLMLYKARWCIIKCLLLEYVLIQGKCFICSQR